MACVGLCKILMRWMVLRGGSKGQVGAWVVWVAHQSDLVFVSMWASVCAAGLVFGLVFSRGCGSRGFVDDCLCNSLQCCSYRGHWVGLGRLRPLDYPIYG